MCPNPQETDTKFKGLYNLNYSTTNISIILSQFVDIWILLKSEDNSIINRKFTSFYKH
jgi:hypothetical protein